MSLKCFFRLKRWGVQCYIVLKLSTTHNDRDPIPLDRRHLDRIAQSIVDLSIVPNIILHSLTFDLRSYYHYHLYRSGQFVGFWGARAKLAEA
jgi:hypothetical protein